MSKAAAELVAASWRRTYFPADRIDAHGVRLATARAGNVIGGGDWAADRLLPDCIAAMTEKRPIAVRNPDSVRPWQHVLEPLGGYLQLGSRLMASEPPAAGSTLRSLEFRPRRGKRPERSAARRPPRRPVGRRQLERLLGAGCPARGQVACAVVRQGVPSPRVGARLGCRHRPREDRRVGNVMGEPQRQHARRHRAPDRGVRDRCRRQGRVLGSPARRRGTPNE